MSSETQITEEKRKGDGRKKVLIGVVVAIFILLVGSVVAMAAVLINTNKSKKEDTAVDNRYVNEKGIVTAENAEELASEIFSEPAYDPKAPRYYTVTQNSNWEFPSGNEPSTNAYVANDYLNESPVYFDLILNETEEVIYSSPILELGAEIKNFKLDKPLEAGKYDCTVEYHLIDEDQNTLTTVNMGVDVTILN